MKTNLYCSLAAVLGLGVYTQAQEAGIPLNGDALFGDLTARQIGPALMSGRVTDVEGHTTNNRVIYIGTAGGGVWKSGDGGVSFSSIFDEYCQSIGCVEVDPSDPDNTLWVGTGEVWTRNSVSVGDGLYKTEDGGTNWKKMGLEKTERISSVQVNPSNPAVVYVGALGALWGPSNDRGVYKTEDGGASWTNLLSVNETTGCSELVMDPNNPDVLYAAFWEFRRTAWSFNSGGENSALYKTVDGGKTWNKIHNGFPAGKLGRIAVAVSPSNSDILYAVLETEKDADKGLYRSEDAGKTWKHMNNDFGLVVRPFYFSKIVVDPRNPDVVVKAGLSGSISRDGGKTFKSLGSMHSDIHDIWFDIKDSDRMCVATDGGLYRTLDGGNTMEIVENLPLSQFYHITVDNEEPYNVYGGLQDNGSWYGPSASPGGIEAKDWEGVGYGDGFRVYPHPGNADILYSEMQGAESIWRYNKAKKQTKIVKPYAVDGDVKLRFNWNTPIQTSPHKPDRLYVGSQFVHRSEDMGDSWVKISPDLTTNDKNKLNQVESGGLSKDNSGAENHCTVFTITESPLDEKIIWAGTDDGQVQVTQDGGANWTNVTANIPALPANTWCYHIETGNFGKGTAYAVFDGHTQNDGATYVYKTTDFGQTWKSIVTDEIVGFARSIQEDYENEDLLFLGTEFGLYITVDGGLHWAKFTNNVPAVAIHALTLHPKTHDLVMGTHGRGVIILDDIRPLRQIKKEMLSEKLHFMKQEPTVMNEETPFGGNPFGGPTFVGANPSSSAQIIYYLSKRHTFGKMTMKIMDQEGNMVTELAPGKRKGINVVNWNYISRVPKVAKGKTFSLQGMVAPRVAAGTYKVVITKGKETFESELVLKYNENSIFSMEDRKVQQEATKQLFDMSEQLAYTVYQIDAQLESMGQLDAASIGKKEMKLVQEFEKELNTLKEDLVVMSGDNYVGAAEPQLREKIGKLYGAVASYYGKPSQAQMENLKMLDAQFNEAQNVYAGLKKKYYIKYQELLKGADLPELELKSFETFVQ